MYSVWHSVVICLSCSQHLFFLLTSFWLWCGLFITTHNRLHYLRKFSQHQFQSNWHVQNAGMDWLRVFNRLFSLSQRSMQLHISDLCSVILLFIMYLLPKFETVNVISKSLLYRISIVSSPFESYLIYLERSRFASEMKLIASWILCIFGNFDLIILFGKPFSSQLNRCEAS